MSPKEYLSHTAAVILQAVANDYRYGFDIMDVTGLPSGTIYPALRRLEEMGFVESRWEKDAIAQREQRPPRKYYEVTAGGEAALALAVKRYRFLERLLSASSRKAKPSRERG
jgi:PadR family transcriptional regulator PadR